MLRDVWDRGRRAGGRVTTEQSTIFVPQGQDGSVATEQGIRLCIVATPVPTVRTPHLPDQTTGVTTTEEMIVITGREIHVFLGRDGALFLRPVETQGRW